jgi:hypothetical protein
MRTSVPGRTSCSRPGLGIFLANAAWLTCAAFAHNLLRAA